MLFRSTPEQWFKVDPPVDAEIARRFGAVRDTIAMAAPDTLLGDAKTSLAAVIALDQFPRNLFRGTARAFETDAKALVHAERAIALGHDQETDLKRRKFYYLPFEHAEDPELQARSVALFSTLGDPEADRYAVAHKVIIDRFGRFPHRNAALGRVSTAEELAFLKEPMSSF